MKQQASKNSKAWLWLAAGAVALLVIVGVVLAIVLPGQGGQQDPAAVSSALYWNVDRQSWVDESGLSTRIAGEDGLFHVRFAVGGQQVELPVSDKQLINYIDTMNVMGLQLDGDGVVIDALEPKEVATEVAKEMFIKSIEGDTIMLNSSLAMNGMDVKVTVSQGTGIYDVDPDAEVVGQISEPGIMDKVSAYANEAGEVTDIFISERAVEAGVYWRVEKMYDSTKLCTTREPDENGAYTINFAHNGEQVELKCKDRDLVNTIDAANNIYGEFALVLDDEGYIVDEVDVGLALRGLKACNNYDVTEVSGNGFTALRNLAGNDKGKEYSNVWDADCDIFLVENGCEAEFVGQRVDSLKVGDRITVYTDLEGKPIVIFVVNREVDSPMYYRLDTYSTKNGVTLRPQDAKGYYIFNMACEGKQVTLRCKDPYIATRIEWRNPAMLGLTLEGDVIVDYHPAGCVCGWSTAFNNYYVASVSAPIVTLINPETGSTYNRLLAADAEIYDMTGNYGMEMGTATTLQVGDKVTCARNIADELTHVYVLQHYEKDAKLYFNMNRRYNTTTQGTNRTPDENGYYVFEMLCEGKQYTLKTKDKKMADWIEAQSTQMVALTVSGSTIKNAYIHVTAFEQGYRPVNYNYVRSINKADNTFTTYYYDGDLVKENKSSTGEYNIRKMAKDCVVYNVSTGYLNQRGEKTTLKVDDQIQTFAKQDTGEIFLILVISRKIDSPVYWHVSQKYNSNTKETTRVADADGWYIYDLFVDGQIKQFKTKDKEVANKVDSYSNGFALYTKGDVILNAYPSNVAKNVKTTAAGHYDIMQIKGNDLSLTRTRPLAGDYGKTAQITMYKGTKIYDVSTYAENRGAKATVSVGDRVTVYSNMEGKAEYIFINYKNTHEKGHISYCEHCDKEVLWEPYSQSFYETDGHYYIPADMTSWAQKRVGADTEDKPDFEIVLDLNGKTVTAKNRLALVYSKFTLLDTVGGGKIIGENAANGNGGVIMVTGGGQLDVLSGELTMAADAGISRNGGVLYIGSQSIFNMYGGTITGGAAKFQENNTALPLGGNVFITGSTFNMYGGTITGGTATGGSGGNLYLVKSATFNMEGGKIDGEFAFENGAKLTLSGTPVISGTGLSIDRGALVKLGELKKGAAIAVKGNGVFTEATDKAESYVNYFVPAEEGASISVEENALCYNRPPVDYKADLKFREGTQIAECPNCGKEVTWTAIDQATYGETGIAKHANSVTSVHYYLAEDITYTGTDIFFTALDSYMQDGKRILKTSCFHLNGHNFTATAARVFQGNTGILNVMGTGTVSGNYNSTSSVWNSNNSATVGINTTIQEGTVNLYSGTYVKPADNTHPIVNIYSNGGNIILHKDAVIDGTGTPGVAVAVYNGVFGIAGGKVIAGSDNAVGVYAYSDTAKGSFGMTAGTVTGGVEVQKGTTMALSGAPVIEGAGISMAADTLLQVGELTEGASIKIMASGVFTEALADAEGYKAYFVPGETGATIEVVNGALSYKEPVRLMNDPLVFDPGTQNAYCMVCKKKVTWTELNQEKNGETFLAAPSGAATHYYLSEDIVYTGTTGFITAGGTYNNNGVTAQKTVCVHLNGHDLTATQTRVFVGSTGILNVLGEGKVSGNNNAANNSSTVHLNSTAGQGVINLYGGTYVKPVENDKGTIVFIGNNGGTINLYEGATIDGTGCSAGSNAVSAAVNGGTPTQSNTNLGPAAFNICGGKIIGSVSVKTQYASFSMDGGEINGTVTVTNGDQLSLSGAAKISELSVAPGMKLDVSGLTEGAEVKVSATGVFTKEYDKIGDIAAYIKPVDEHAKITVKGSALSCEKDYNGALNFTEGSKAYCAVCDKEVEWTELNQEKNGETFLAAPSAAATHYYLSEDITYTGTTVFITAGGTYNNNGVSAQKTVCVHLNGNDLTATQARIFQSSTGILNVMGQGTVSGGYVGTTDYAKSTGATVNMNSTAVNGTFNLYGGTYTKAEGSPNATVVVHENGGIVNVYEGATVEGGASVYHGALNIYGAEVKGELKVAVRTAGKTPAATVTDATVESVSVTGGSFTLSGASKLSLAIAEGMKITLGEMTEGAAITVSANGVFTETNEKAGEYKKYFTAAEGTIEAQDNALVCQK